MMYGYYGNYAGAYPFHFLGAIFMVIFWVFVIVLIVRLVRGARHNRHWRGWDEGDYPDRNRTPPDTAVNILKERYAKGEITKEQFESMKKDIQ